MEFDQINPSVRACYATHQVFIQLGFHKDHLFIHVQQGKLLLVLKRNPTVHEFAMEICPIDMTQDQFLELWTPFVLAKNGKQIEIAVLDKIMAEFMAKFNSAMFCAVLLSKGISIPVNLPPNQRRPDLN